MTPDYVSGLFTGQYKLIKSLTKQYYEKITKINNKEMQNFI